MSTIVFLPMVLALVGPWTPRVDDAAMIREAVHYLSVEKSSGGLVISGYLPTPCHKLRIAEIESNGRFDIDVYSVISPDEICLQTLTWFRVEYELIRAEVFVNGMLVQRAVQVRKVSGRGSPQRAQRRILGGAGKGTAPREKLEGCC